MSLRRGRSLDVASTLGLTGLLLAVLSGGVATTAAAQGGGDLGSPWGPGTRRAPASERPAETPAVEPRAPEDSGTSRPSETVPQDVVAIPPPPGADVLIPPAPGGAYALPGASIPPLRETAGLRLPSTISTRLRALEGDLQALAQRGGGYIVDGVVQLLSSGVSIAVGVLFFTSGGEEMSAYLFTMGGVGVARGILTLAMPMNPSESAVSYAHPLPLTSYREARARLRAREAELSGLAEISMIGRVVDGSLGIGVGVAMIPIFAALGFDTSNPYNYVMLLLAAVSTVTGVITLFSTSDAERRWAGYRELRDRLAVTGAGSDDERWLEEHADDEPEFSLAPHAEPTLSVAVGFGGGSLSVTF